MAYLSQNHCLETLEFTMDAKRYRQHYEKTVAKSFGGYMIAGSEESIYMLGLWQRLMQAYIQPNGAREVNLPSEVRDALLSQDLSSLPPHPDSLNAAIEKVHELMEESVLVPFLNSLYPQSGLPESNDSSAEDLTASSFDERGLFRSRTNRKIRRRRSPNSSSPPLSKSTPNTSLSPASPPPIPIPANPAHRASAPSAITQFGRSLSQSVRQGFHSHNPSQAPSRPLSTLSQGLQNVQGAPTSGLSSLTPTSSSDSPALIVDDVPPPPPLPLAAMTDDNDSTPSAAPEPMTPPTTPPMSDLHNSPVSAGARPANPWKRMRYSFGWRKKSDHENEFPGP
jgi:Regulator of G protein signaling domain